MRLPVVGRSVLQDYDGDWLQVRSESFAGVPVDISGDTLTETSDAFAERDPSCRLNQRGNEVLDAGEGTICFADDPKARTLTSTCKIRALDRSASQSTEIPTEIASV